ncbi:MAG: ATP-binding protein [Planctomycetaceae bacterium]
MSWKEVIGQDRAIEVFRRAVACGRLASTFLLVGPAGVGKRLVAEKLAQALLCEKCGDHQLEACGHCPSCTQVAAGSHPDVLRIRKPDDKAFIPIDLLIGDKEHRMRAGLCYDISLRPYSGKRRIAILDDADYLNQEGANALLKTLEEPPPKSVLLLLGTSLQRQLPTIRSRCQIVPFKPLSVEAIENILLQQQLVMESEQAHKVAVQSDGSLENAQAVLAPGFSDFRSMLLESLADGEFDLLAVAKATAAFVDTAGKDAAQKRLRLKHVIGIGLSFLRQVLLQQAGEGAISTASPDQELTGAAARALRWYQSGAEDGIDACIQAMGYVDSNANQANLIEWWLDELVQRGIVASQRS